MGIVTDTYSAKANLSKLLDAVERGEEVTITRRGKPVARLVGAAAERPRRRRLGVLAGQIGPVPDDDAHDQEWQQILRIMTGEEIEEGAPEWP